MCPLCFALLTSTTPPPKLHLTIFGSDVSGFFSPHLRKMCLISRSVHCTEILVRIHNLSVWALLCLALVEWVWQCCTELFHARLFYTITGVSFNTTGRPIQNQPAVHGYFLVSVTGQEACEYTGILCHHVQFDIGDLILHSVYHSVEKRKKQGFCHSLVAPWPFACQPDSKTMTITNTLGSTFSHASQKHVQSKASKNQ